MSRIAAWEEGQGEGFSLLDLGAALLRYRWLVVALTLAVPALVVLVTFFSTRQWRATASFMPQTAMDAPSPGLSSLVGQLGFDLRGGLGQSPQFYARLIRSRALLSELARDTFEVDGGHTLAELLELQDDREAFRRAAVVRWLRNGAISVSTDSRTGVVDVSVTTRWPALSSQLGNRILELVNEFNLEKRQSQAAAERNFVEERMNEAEIELKAAEDALQEFLQRNRQFENSPELSFEYDRLQRRVNARQQVYTSLVQTYEQARIAEVRNIPVITVTQEAEEPVTPISRQLLLKGVAALILGMMLGFVAAFGAEYVRRHRREDSEELKEFAELWEDTKADIGHVFRYVRFS